jgi:hypothetical protein
MSLRQFLKPETLPGSIEREHQVHPFSPASVAPRSVRDNFMKFKKKEREKALHEEFVQRSRRTKKFAVVDAESKEEITLTKAVWTPNEGQLGNGKLCSYCIFYRLAKE